jgi:hypothetical protein
VKSDFEEQYWNGLWAWLEHGGCGHLAAYLTDLNIVDFNIKAPPPKTATFWEIVGINMAPEDAELADVLDAMGQPDVITLAMIRQGCLLPPVNAELAEWLGDRRNRRVIPHRLEQCGYVAVRNDGAKDGQWKIAGKRQTLYAKSNLSPMDRLTAAGDFMKLHSERK